MNDEIQTFLEHFGKKGQKWGVVRATPKGRTLKDRANSKGTSLNDRANSKGTSLTDRANSQKNNTLKNKVKASRVKAGDKVYLNDKQAKALIKKELNVRPGSKGLTRSGKPKGIRLKTKIKNSRDLPLLNEIKNQQSGTLRKKVKKAEKSLRKKKYSTIKISEPTIINGRKFVADFEFKLNARTGEIGQTSMDNKGEAFLEHFGKKGQKWGVRKASATDSGGTNASPKATAPKATAPKATAPKAKKAGKYTKAGKLSNKQLKESVDRMRLEKDYNALVADKKSQSTGRRLLGKTLKTTEDIAFNTLDVQGKRVANALIGKELDKTLGIESSRLTNIRDFVKGEKVKAAAQREADDLKKKQNAPRSFIPPTGNSRKPAKGSRRFKP
jgi:hypothetical protein